MVDPSDNIHSFVSNSSEDSIHEQLNGLRNCIYSITHYRGREIDEKTLSTYIQEWLKYYRDVVEILLEELEKRALEASIQEFGDSDIS